MELPPIIAQSSLAAILAAIFSGSGLVAILTFVTRWRGMSIDSEAQLRADLAKELGVMRQHMRDLEAHYRSMLEDSDRRHEECQLDRDKLRDRLAESDRRVQHLEDEITGLKRQIAQYSANRLTELEGKPSERAPEATKSAPRVRRITEENGDG